jgi:hypothetical protein
MKKLSFGVTVWLTIFLGASVALAAVPGVTGEGSAPPKVKPKTIIYTGDGSGFFAGATKVSESNFGSLHWTKWTSGEALGSGANWLDNCTPDCATGTFNGYPLTLKLGKPKVVGGHDVFTRLTITYTGKRPPHTHKTATWKLKYESSAKFFVWGFSV